MRIRTRTRERITRGDRSIAARGRFARLAGLVGLVWMGSSPGILFTGLVAVPSAGCVCDCQGDYNHLRVGSATAMSSLEVTGDACGLATCVWSPDGPCRQYELDLLRAGSCHLTATATDGRFATLDVTVTVSKTTCCGDIYATGSPDRGVEEVIF